MTVDGRGISLVTDLGETLGAFGADITFDSGRIYSTSGQVLDPIAMRTVGTVGASGLVAPDSTVHKIFFLTNDFGLSPVVKVFNQQTFVPVGSFDIPGAAGSFNSFFRWGDDGLAFGRNADFSGSGSDQIFLIQTPFACLSSAQ